MSVRSKAVAASAICLLTALAVPAAIVWACVSVAALTASPLSAQPGGTVTVTGGDYVPGFPVQIHLDTVTGPVLATVASPTGGSSMRSTFKTDVTLPSGLSTGQHVLIATQDAHNMTAGIPARAVIYVGIAPPGAQHSTRSAGPSIESGLSVGSLALIAAAAAVVGLVLLVGVLLLTSARPPRPGAAGA